MSIEFFGVGGPGQIGSIKKTQASKTDKKEEVGQADKVQFSSVLQDLPLPKEQKGCRSSRPRSPMAPMNPI